MNTETTTELEQVSKPVDGESELNGGLGVNDGPEFSDGHDCEGFPGGCARFGCPGAVSQHLCTALPKIELRGE